MMKRKHGDGGAEGKRKKEGEGERKENNHREFISAVAVGLHEYWTHPSTLRCRCNADDSYSADAGDNVNNIHAK